MKKLGLSAEIPKRHDRIQIMTVSLRSELLDSGQGRFYTSPTASTGACRPENTPDLEALDGRRIFILYR